MRAPLMPARLAPPGPTAGRFSSDGVDGSPSEASHCAMLGAVATNGRMATLGIDLAKSVFQLHGVNEAGIVVLRPKLRRTALLAFLSDLPACRIGIEACASAHDWARRISAMDMMSA
jgi:hypothetical protein